MKKIGLYANPFAGREGRELEGIPVQVSDISIYIPKTEQLIKDKLQEIKNDGIDILFIYGGDGTLHKFLTDWFNLFEEKITRPIIIPLHGGTMNIVATAMGISTNSFYAVRKIVSLLEKDEEKFCYELSLLKVTGSKSGNLYGLEVALGPAVNFLKEYEDGPKGLWQVARIFVLSIATVLFGLSSKFRNFLKKLKCQLEIDGTKVKRQEFTVIYCSIIHRVIFGFRPFKDTHGLRGFRFLAYTISPLVIVVRLLLLAFAILPKSDKYINSSAEEIKLTGLEGAIFTVDGDVYESGDSLKIEEGPKVQFFSFKKFN